MSQFRKLTIGKLADAAGVGVETIRFYERKGLVVRPGSDGSGYRTYSSETLARVRFIKRAQKLGFSLSDIGDLLALQDGTNREKIRQISSQRLQDIREKIRDLSSMEELLSTVLEECSKKGKSPKCPIIQAIEPEQEKN